MNRARIASFVPLRRHDLQKILVDHRLDYRRSLTLRIPQMCWVRRSWDFEIGDHFGGSRRHGSGSGFWESKSVEYVEDCASGGEENEIGPA